MVVVVVVDVGAILGNIVRVCTKHRVLISVISTTTFMAGFKVETEQNLEFKEDSYNKCFFLN